MSFNSDFIGDSNDSSSERVKIATCGSPTDCHCQSLSAVSPSPDRVSEFHSVSDDHGDDDVIV